MTETESIEIANEVVEVAVESVVKRGRGRPRKEKPIKEKRPRGRPRKLGPIREKRPRGRPRKIREFREKRPPGRPRTWTDETSPKYKLKGPDYNKKYYRNVAKPKLEAKKAESRDIRVQLQLMTKLLGTTIAEIIELMRSSSVTWRINSYGILRMTTLLLT